MIYQTVNFSTFCDAFHNMGRSEQFTYEGKKALFDFLEEISDGCEDVELDVIALCCDYSEMTYEELVSSYNENGQYGNKDDFMQWVNDNTMVLEVSEDNFIVQAF